MTAANRAEERRTPMTAQRLRSAWRRFNLGWAVFRRNWLAITGLVIMGVFLALALAYPVLMGRVWNERIYDPVIGGDFEVMPRPSGSVEGHPLGVDALGRDNLSRLMVSTQSALVLAASAAISSALFSLFFGAVSAYKRGVFDSILFHTANAIMLFPAPILMIVLSARFFEQITTPIFGVIYGSLVGLGSGMVVMRAKALVLMEESYIEAARVSGANGWYIIQRHLWPHMMPLAAAHMMQAVVGAIVSDGFISFFGFRDVGVSYGHMVYESFTWLRVLPGGITPWVAILAPTLSLSLFAAAFYFISRGLHDVADPRLQTFRGADEGARERG